MYKHMRKYIFVGISLIILFVLVIIANPFEKKKTNSIEENILNVQNYNRILFNSKNLEMVLNQVYFSNQIPKHFNSVGLTLPLPKLYDMYWGLNIIGSADKINLESIISIKSDKYIELINKSFMDSSFPYLLKEFYITGIYNYIGYSDYDRIGLSREINRYYNKDESLYFLKDINESETDKLSATLTAIRIHKNMGLRLEHKEQIVKKSIDLYNNFNDEIFEGSVIEKFNYMSSIITILRELGEDYRSLEDILTFKNTWITTDEINNLMDKSNPLILLYAKKLYDINSFYGILIKYDKETLDIMTSRSFVTDTNEVVFEPSLVNYALELYKNNNHYFLFQKELNSFLKKSIESKFNKSGYTQISFEDNFYGLSIAKLINFSFEKDLHTEFLKTSFTALFEDDTNISSNNKLKDIYYLLLSFKIMEIEIPDQDIISNSITHYLLSLEGTKENFQINFDAYDLGFRVLTLLDQKVTSKLRSDINKFIDEFTQDDLMLNSSIDYQYKMLSIISNAHLTKNEVFSKILINIEGLKDLNGYKSNYKSESSDVFSTFKAYIIIKSIKPLDTISIKDAQSFISGDISFNDPLGYNSKYESMNLKTIFYSMMLSGIR